MGMYITTAVWRACAIVAICFALSACATISNAVSATGQAGGNMLGDLCASVIGSQACASATQNMSSVEASGMAYGNRPYQIYRTPMGRYALRIGQGEAVYIDEAKSVQIMGSHRTAQATFEVLKAPSAECPERHIIIMASARANHISPAIGCAKPLEFATRPEQNLLFATEKAQFADGHAPWSYRIRATRVDAPAMVSSMRDHPDYAAYHRPSAPTQQSRQRTATSNTTTPARQPPAPPPAPVAVARPIPTAERVSIPPPVEEKAPEYERPRGRL